MGSEGIIREILEYLKKEGSTNTFKMARAIGLERNKLLTVIGRLEKKEAVKLERGNVIFLKFPVAEKPVKAISPRSEQKNIDSILEPKKIEKAVANKLAISKPAKPRALLRLQSENKQLQRKVLQMGETMKELERKALARPKTITKTVTRTIIRKVPVTKTVIKEVPVIKTVIKKVPITKTVVRRIQVPTPRTETRIWEKLKAHSEQIKISGSKFGSKLLGNMKQLKEPEFMKR